MIRNSYVMCILSVLVAVVCHTAVPMEAEADVICRKSDGETLITKRRARRCTRRGGTVLTYSTLKGETGATGATGPTGPSGSSTILCFAKVQSDGTVTSYGGQGTTGVTVNNATTGYYEVTCTGSYSGITGVSDISGLATTAVSLYNIAVNDGDSASTTQIELKVYIRQLDATAANADFQVMVLAETS